MDEFMNNAEIFHNSPESKLPTDDHLKIVDYIKQIISNNAL